MFDVFAKPLCYLLLSMGCQIIMHLLWPSSLLHAASPENTTSSSSVSKRTDWPRWRGIAFDGISIETDWSCEWPESGPAQVWERSIGIGFSSFAVRGQRLYTMGSVIDDSEEASAEEDTSERVDVIWCLDALSGEVIWTLKYPADLVDVEHEGGPSATPTIYDNRGYTVSKQGHFVCFDAETGNALWTHSLTKLLGVEMPMWGFSGSPLIVNDLVIFEAGRTVAFNRQTGELVWQTESFNPAYSSPVCFPHPETGSPVVASLNNDVLLTLDAASGKEIARSPFETVYPTNSCTPIIHRNTIFLSSGYNRGCTLLRFTGTALDPVYDNRNMRNQFNSCVLKDGYLYGFDGNSHSRRTATIRCIEHRTGEIKWIQRGYGVGSLILAGDRFIALSDQGEMLIFKANPTEFELLASAKIIDGKCWTPPVLCNGLLYVRNAAGRLVCLDLRG